MNKQRANCLITTTGIGVIMVIVVSAAQCVALPTPLPSSSANTERTPIPTIPPVSATVTPSSTQIAAPSWQGITPGQTTKEEVLRILGQPNTIQTYGDLQSLNYYPKAWVGHNYRVVVRNNVVQLVIVNEGDTNQRLSDLVGENGIFEALVEHPGAWYTDVYVLASRGLAAAGVRDFRISTEYFVPMSTDEYLKSWGQYHPYDRPFPTQCITHPLKMGIIPDQSTREDVHRIYGDPDRIGPVDEWGLPPGYTGTTSEWEVYYYRIPEKVETQNTMDWQTSFNFVFDEQGVVRLVHLWGVVGPRWTLADAITEYGEPEWMFKKKGRWSEFPENPRGYVFLKKGVAVVAMGYWEPRPTDRLQSEWFYAPMSWEEYQGSWGMKPWFGGSYGWARGDFEPVKWTGFPSPSQ